MARGAKEIHLSGRAESIKALADAIYADIVLAVGAGWISCERVVSRARTSADARIRAQMLPE
jgi:hypothetical protein